MESIVMATCQRKTRLMSGMIYLQNEMLGQWQSALDAAVGADRDRPYAE